MVQTLPLAADNHADANGPISVYDFAVAPSFRYAECFRPVRT